MAQLAQAPPATAHCLNTCLASKRRRSLQHPYSYRSGLQAHSDARHRLAAAIAARHDAQRPQGLLATSCTPPQEVLSIRATHMDMHGRHTNTSVAAPGPRNASSATATSGEVAACGLNLQTPQNAQRGAAQHGESGAEPAMQKAVDGRGWPWALPGAPPQGASPLSPPGAPWRSSSTWSPNSSASRELGGIKCKIFHAGFGYCMPLHSATQNPIMKHISGAETDKL